MKDIILMTVIVTLIMAVYWGGFKPSMERFSESNLSQGEEELYRTIVNYLNEKELADFKMGQTGIFSITVFARKPIAGTCCTPGGGCC